MIKNIFSTALTFLITLLIFILWLGETHSGLKFLVTTLNQVPNINIQAKKIEGRIFSHLQLENFSLQVLDIDFTAQHLDLQWTLWPILFKHVKIYSLIGDGIHINLQRKKLPSTVAVMPTPTPKPRSIKNSQLLNINLQKEIKTVVNTLGWVIEIGNMQLKKISLEINHQPSGEFQHLYVNLNTKNYFLKLDTVGHVQLQWFNENLSGQMQFAVLSHIVRTPQKNLRIDLVIPYIKGFYQKIPIDASSQIFLENHALQVENTHIRYGGMLFNLKGKSNTTLWRFDWTYQLKNVQTYLPSATGSINANGNVTLDPKNLLNFKAITRILPGQMQFIIKDAPYLQSYAGGTLITESNAKGILSYLTFALRPDHNITGELRVPPYRFKEWLRTATPINGKFQLLVSDFTPFINRFIFLTEPTGKINGEFQLLGPIDKLKFQGDVQLTDASFHLPLYNLNIKNLNLKMNVQDKTKNKDDFPIHYKGSLQSGGGELQLQGTTNFQSQKIISKLELTGKSILVSDMPGLQIFASPQLIIQAQNNLIDITGKVLIPQATIRKTDFGGAETPSDDIVIVEPHAATQTSQGNLAFRSTLELILGDKVTINTGKLAGRLTGEIKIFYQMEHPTTAIGQLGIVDGTYKVFGQILQIREGQLLFTGGVIDDPILNVEAARTVKAIPTDQGNFTSSLSGFSIATPQSYNAEQDVVVGVELTGRLHKTSMKLFADPAQFQESEILSLLLTGNTIANVGKNQLQLLLQAANALHEGSGKPGKIAQIQSQIKSKLGIDELTIGTVQQYDTNAKSINDGSALIIGKKLSKRLYVNFDLGLYQTTDTLRFRYQLWNNLFLQSDASADQSGVDLIYTISKKN